LYNYAGTWKKSLTLEMSAPNPESADAKPLERNDITDTALLCLLGGTRPEDVMRQCMEKGVLIRQHLLMEEELAMRAHMNPSFDDWDPFEDAIVCLDKIPDLVVKEEKKDNPAPTPEKNAKAAETTHE
jgi:hypothetical protein